tara:strand:- start:162 stop:1361 length:1200 start_codon:yes stop_codon:yes gene_type:complete
MNKINNVKFVIGKKELETRPITPFNSLTCEFLNELSQSLIKDKFAQKFSDVISFAFWCRKANINIIKKKLIGSELRLGLGLVFHVTPSNVPVNFAFSFAFGLLTGNANLVKLPSKNFPQINIICKKITYNFNKKKFKIIKKMNSLLQYDSQNDEITKEFSCKADGRIIWGGDETIKKIKKFETKNRVIDISFGDKYSFCVIDSTSVNKISNIKLKKLIEQFYNDTYIMDQNACSSPHLIIWLGSNKNITKAKNKFWDELIKYVKLKYVLDEINVIDKFEQLCSDAIELDYIDQFHLNENLIYRIKIKKLPKNFEKLKGKFGYFYEYNSKDINCCAELVNSKFQTLVYYGVSQNKLSNFVLTNRLKGIDRIVPVGQALDIGFVWDGYNLDKSLTRIIDLK